MAIVVASDDLLKASGQLVSNVFAAELSGAVAAETDAAFLREITAGVSSITSAGGTASGIDSRDGLKSVHQKRFILAHRTQLITIPTCGQCIKLPWPVTASFSD